MFKGLLKVKSQRCWKFEKKASERFFKDFLKKKYIAVQRIKFNGKVFSLSILTTSYSNRLWVETSEKQNVLISIIMVDMQYE